MDKRLVKSCSVVVGHYGGGKTNFAVNLALALKAEKPQTPVRIADLDTVNPYFRTADASELLLSRGVIPLLPEFAGSNVDIPMIPSALRSAVRDPAGFTVVDVGGDDGAVALGMFRSDIKAADAGVFFVVNRFRPLIATAEGARDCMAEIEELSGLRCTALVNNSNLGAETEARDLLDSLEYARECAELCSLPILCHCYMPALVPDLPEKFASAGEDPSLLFPMEQATKQLF